VGVGRLTGQRRVTRGGSRGVRRYQPHEHGAFILVILVILVIFGYFLVIFGYFLVIFGYFWLFLVILVIVRTGNCTDAVFCSFVHRLPVSSASSSRPVGLSATYRWRSSRRSGC
jgi:vacuolar-type H+-ATPase subunit I/STV1